MMAHPAAELPAVEWRLPAGPQPRTSGSLPELSWLLATVILAAAPHLPHVAAWITMSLLAASLWRLGAALRRWPLPGRWMRGILTLAGFLGVLFTYRRISGVDPGSALLMIMLALKLLETRRERDRVIVILIAWFLLFAAFLREQALWSAGYLLVGLLLGTAALLASTRGSPPLNPLLTVRLSVRLLLPAVPLALLLFLLFPRLPGPFWALPNQDTAARTGLSEEISPGDISALALSNAVAFRVRFNGPAPSPDMLYWRGPVLERFDGRRWQAAANRPNRTAGGGVISRSEAGPLYEYEIILEPHGKRWLLPLESLVAWDAESSALGSSGELIASRNIDQRTAWRGRSRLLDSVRAEEQIPARLTWLPAERNPRSRQLALDMRAAAATDEDYIAAILRMFAEQPFYYSLEPPTLGQSPVDDFLFESRNGFCEHYASAFAMLARAAGIPARIIAGYQGGERNPIGNYWIIRQSDAHAWVELLLDGHWVRVDPTTAIAPERILAGRDLAGAGGTFEGIDRFTNLQLINRLMLSWDAANASWDRWVLAFGPDSQLALLETLGLRAPSTRTLVALLSTILLGGIMLMSFLYGRTARGRQADPAAQLWEQFCARLGRSTRARRPAEGPVEYAEAVLRTRPELAGEIRAVTRLYLALRYEGRADPQGLGRFRRAVRGFRPARR